MTDPQRRCVECGKPFQDGDRITADGRVEPPIIRHRECAKRTATVCPPECNLYHDHIEFDPAEVPA